MFKWIITTTVINTNFHQNGQVHQSDVVTTRQVQQALSILPNPVKATPGSTLWQDAPGSVTETANNQYDINGFLVQHTESASDGTDRSALSRSFVNNGQGMALYVNEGANSGGMLENPTTGYYAGYTGDANSAKAGNVQRQLVVNGEALARYGMAQASDGTSPTAQSTLEVNLNAVPLTGASGQPTTSNYTTQRGETLQSIARTVYGDARLWYRLADANGLAVGPDVQLTEGLTLSVPSTALSSNSVDTFQPYNPSKITGSTGTTLPNLPVPAQDSGGGCGAMGQIVMMIVTVVVAIYAPQMLPELFEGMSPVVAAATSAAIGSVAGQAVGNAIGAVHGFSWSQVAMAAITAGVAKGVGVPNMGLGPVGNGIASAAIGNALTQGIEVVTGLKDHFDWTAVVGSAVGSAAGYGMNAAIGEYASGQVTLTAGVSCSGAQPGGAQR